MEDFINGLIVIISNIIFTFFFIVFAPITVPVYLGFYLIYAIQEIGKNDWNEV